MEGGSANDYDYVSGDPVNNLDLDGLCKKKKGIGIIRNAFCHGGNVVTKNRVAKAVGGGARATGRVAVAGLKCAGRVTVDVVNPIPSDTADLLTDGGAVVTKLGGVVRIASAPMALSGGMVVAGGSAIIATAGTGLIVVGAGMMVVGVATSIRQNC